MCLGVASSGGCMGVAGQTTNQEVPSDTTTAASHWAARAFVAAPSMVWDEVVAMVTAPAPASTFLISYRAPLAAAGRVIVIPPAPPVQSSVWSVAVAV